MDADQFQHHYHDLIIWAKAAGLPAMVIMTELGHYPYGLRSPGTG